MNLSAFADRIFPHPTLSEMMRVSVLDAYGPGTPYMSGGAVMQYRMPGRPWFRSLRKGLPAQPLTWEGWVFTGAYVAGLASFAHAARVLPPYTEPPLIAPFVVAVLVLTGFFLVFCWLKSELPADAVDRPKAKVEIMHRGNDKRPPPTPWV